MKRTGNRKKRITIGDPMQDCMPQRSTYPEEVEANGEVRLPVAVPVPGLLEQGHQHTARHQKHPALLGLPDRQQELGILPKGVWGRTKQGETAPRLPSHVVPQATERYTNPGHLPQIPTQGPSGQSRGSSASALSQLPSHLYHPRFSYRHTD